MIELILLIPIGFLGYLLWRADQRYDRALMVFEAERRELLQRIQAPERAVIEDFEPQFLDGNVALDDDDAYWKEKERLAGDGTS